MLQGFSLNIQSIRGLQYPDLNHKGSCKEERKIFSIHSSVEAISAISAVFSAVYKLKNGFLLPDDISGDSRLGAPGIEHWLDQVTKVEHPAHEEIGVLTKMGSPAYELGEPEKKSFKRLKKPFFLGKFAGVSRA
jgi:hypothetical protein